MLLVKSLMKLLGRGRWALFGATIAFGAPDATAQVPRPGRSVAVVSVPDPDPSERGWIGVGVDLDVTERGRDPASLVVRIVRTVDGGPAALAGVIPGDVILAIDGEPLTIELWEDFTQNLRRGNDLRLSFDRAGRTREVQLTTTSRPSLAPVPMELNVYLDSVRTSFWTQIRSNSGVWASRDYVTLLMAEDSVENAATRILAQARQDAVNDGVRPRLPADVMVPPEQDGSRYSVVWNTDAALPLEYLMLKSPEADSVKTAIIHLRGELIAVNEATQAREQEIRTIVDVRARELGNTDARLLRLRSDNDRVREDLEQLAFRLAEISSNEREIRTRSARTGPNFSAGVRPITARVVGRNFVCGAQFNDLNRQLGAYFGTDRGVLVIQVLDGTPCDDAGLVPGDVVTHVGDAEVGSVEGFRSVLNRSFARGRQAQLMLLRRGERVEATLSR